MYSQAVVKAVYANHNINLLTDPSDKTLREWDALCKIDPEGNARKAVGCSCLVIKGAVSVQTLEEALLIQESRFYFRLLGSLDSRWYLQESWKGDGPCESWYGISCMEGSITSVTFISLNLTCIISPRFADLTSLTVIDLSHNRLTGTIPDELFTLKYLRILDVSYNQLHGRVPGASRIVIDTQGNPKIETNDIEIVVGISVGAVFVLLIVGGECVALCLILKNKQSSKADRTECGSRECVSVSGGFGSVYRGKLREGTEIVVKGMEQSSSGKGVDEVRSEVSVLTKVHHRSLVLLHGYCIQGNERLLLYQYMPQGTLSRHVSLEGLKD
ncbi:unnamed protein product [Thlaspi arvense]|uniref:Protein kinase domain-containing protein n=1 Tax=Thlaspi arvense TaxID=13288 RepID=A0AAU9R4H6_THLAR|nr:unnamed protein product [Thlaspi arvense]